MIAVLGVLAMVAFVFLDPLMQYLGNDRAASENPVVVETKYGDYTESDLAVIRDTRAKWSTRFCNWRHQCHRPTCKSKSEVRSAHARNRSPTACSAHWRNR